MNRALRMLSDSNKALTRISDETVWLNDVCRNAVDSGGYRMAWVGFAEHDGQKAVRPVAQAGFEMNYLESAQITWVEEPRGRGPAGTAIRTGQPSIVRDVSTDESFGPWREAASARGYQSSIALPLTSEGRTFGVLCLYAAVVDAFDEKEVNVLTELADDLGFGIGVLRLRAERERATQAFLALTENSPDLIARLSRDGRYIYANSTFDVVMGIPASELLDTHIGEATPTLVQAGGPEALLPLRAAVEQVVDAGAAMEREIKMPLRDGTRVFDVRLIPEWDEAGQVATVLLIGRDITERQRAEETLRQVEEQYRHAQRLEAIGRLAGGIAHDFNNLLTAIGGFANLVLGSLKDERDPRRADLLELQRAVERGTALTRQLLAFSRRQVLQPKILDLNHLIANLQALLRRTIGERIELHFTLDANLDRISADAGQLEQVLINLAANARDAMPNGGELRIATDVVHVDEAWQRRHPAIQPPVPSGTYAHLTVTDTGQGMSAETQARIFEPFFTTKPPGKGTGLGLATVYGLLKQSGGFIWVSSQINHGTVFHIYLPAASGNIEPDRRIDADAAAGGSETILVAEDDASVRRLAERTLSQVGYHVLVARDGDEALALARSTAGTIHLLIADIVMPGLTGFALAERLKADRPELRVLFTSGYAEGVTPPDVALGPFLGKPFLPPDLLRRVRDVLDQS